MKGVITSNIGERLTEAEAKATAAQEGLTSKLNRNFSDLQSSAGFSLSDEIPVLINGNTFKVTGQVISNIIGSGSGGTGQVSLSNYIKNCGTISSLPATFQDSNITADMIVLNADISNPEVFTWYPVVNCANGSLTIQTRSDAPNGNTGINGSTSITLYLGIGISESPAILTDLGSNIPDNVLKTAPRPGVTGVLAVGNGGTGTTTLEGIRTNLNVYNKIEVDSAIAQATADMYSKGEVDAAIEQSTANVSFMITNVREVFSAEDKTIHTLNVPNNSLHFLLIESTSTGLHAYGMVASTTSGALVTQTMQKTNGSTLTANTGSITIDLGSTARPLHIVDIRLRGSGYCTLS